MYSIDDQGNEEAMYQKAKRWWTQTLSLYRLFRPGLHPVVQNAERALRKVDQMRTDMKTPRVVKTDTGQAHLKKAKYPGVLPPTGEPLVDARDAIHKDA